MKFHEARKAKFDKGHLEHEQPWDLEHIDHLNEIQDELCDLYNYCSLDEKDSTMRYIMAFAERAWERVEKSKKES